MQTTVPICIQKTLQNLSVTEWTRSPDSVRFLRRFWKRMLPLPNITACASSPYNTPTTWRWKPGRGHSISTSAVKLRGPRATQASTRFLFLYRANGILFCLYVQVCFWSIYISLPGCWYSCRVSRVGCGNAGQHLVHNSPLLVLLFIWYQYYGSRLLLIIMTLSRRDASISCSCPLQVL